MAPKDKIEAVKRHIAVLIRRGDYVVAHEPEYPTKWWPGGVIDPQTGAPFTHAGAWDFIAEKCEEKGTTLREKTLDKPPGKTASVLLEKTIGSTIYVKVHFGADGKKVIGRSFH